MSSPEALSLFARHLQYYFPDPYRQWKQTRGYSCALADGGERGLERGLDARAAFNALAKGAATVVSGRTFYYVNAVLCGAEILNM